VPQRSSEESFAVCDNGNNGGNNRIGSPILEPQGFTSRTTWSIAELVCRGHPAYSTVGFKIKGASQLILSVLSNSMTKRLFFIFIGALSMPVLTLAGQNDATKPGVWSGVIVSSSCNADEAFNESPECFKDVPGAKLALYDDTNRLMYDLEPQQRVTTHLGDTVTVRGTLAEDTIQMASIELMSIGLAVGQKAPAFSVRDQFGHVQSLDTLKGPHGTVLLFFRSADW
jgi:hypothetical protein